MTKAQIALLLERAEAWPQEAQEELIRNSIEIERKQGAVYHLDDEERADIRQGLAEIDRGEIAPDKSVQDTFEDLRRV